MHRGLIDRFRSLPMSSSAVLTGRTIADLGRNLFTVAIMLAVGFAVGFRPGGTIFEFLLGMIIALVVNSSFKGRGVMRAVMLVPWAIPTVVSAQMWKWMYDDIYGVINDSFSRVHIISHNVAWISQPNTALGVRTAGCRSTAPRN